MKFTQWSGVFGIVLGLGLVALGAGCNSQKDEAKKEAEEKIAKEGPAKKEKPKHDHSGWWCEEHGIPEHICSLCLPEEEVRKKFKDAGDWCEPHERAKSQCFKCDPSKYARFEEMYAGKYDGAKPERPPESEFTK